MQTQLFNFHKQHIGKFVYREGPGEQAAASSEKEEENPERIAATRVRKLVLDSDTDRVVKQEVPRRIGASGYISYSIKIQDK